MKPESISERMMYNTVRLLTSNGSCGTGSYFNFKVGEEIVPVIVTNKHVITQKTLIRNVCLTQVTIEIRKSSSVDAYWIICKIYALGLAYRS